MYDLSIAIQFHHYTKIIETALIKVPFRYMERSILSKYYKINDYIVTVSICTI